MTTGCDDPRHTRLAQALRANLKRRKAAGREAGDPPPEPAGAKDAPPDPSARG